MNNNTETKEEALNAAENPLEETLNTQQVDTKGHVDEDEGFGEDEGGRNLIVPQKCVGGHSPVVVHLNKKVEIGEQGASRMKAILFEIFQPSRQATGKLNIPFPNLTSGKELQAVNKARIKQFLNTFLGSVETKVDTKGKSYETIVQEAIDLINNDPKLLKMPFEVKLVYVESNGKYYVNLGKVGNVFSSSIKPRNLDWNPKYDFDEKKESAGGSIGGMRIDPSKADEVV
jgi:hypothetical protein